MTVLVSVETVLLAVLLVLVAGLLRSHAELLRRLGPAEDGALPAGAAASGTRTGSTAERVPGAPAPALQGVTPAGEPAALSFGSGPQEPPTLLAFLSTGCSACEAFWSALARRLPGVQTVIVTHGEDRERPARVAELAPAGVPVVMSSTAWTDYGVPGSPYFLLVQGEIRGEGMAGGWDTLSGMVADALADAELAGPAGAAAAAPARAGRAADVDRRLAAAGINPGHPSLYPGGPADPPRER
jgi:hypothetical protein